MSVVKNVYLKHRAYRDVCIFVPILRIFNGRIKAKGEFWNLAGYPMHIATKVDVSEEQRREWLYTYAPLVQTTWRAFP